MFTEGIGVGTVGMVEADGGLGKGGAFMKVGF